jgi:hypothetical protein
MKWYNALALGLNPNPFVCSVEGALAGDSTGGGSGKTVTPASANAATAGDDDLGDDAASTSKGDKNRTFSQDEVSRIVAEERRKLKGEIRTRLTELERLQKSAHESEEQRAELTTQLDKLNTELMSVEERRKKESELERAKAKEEIDKHTKSAQMWEGKFKSKMINEAVIRAVEPFAHVPSHFLPLIAPDAVLDEVMDKDGKPTGEYSVKVKAIETINGQPHQVLLPIEEFVKHLRENKDYEYMFRSKRAGGTGAGVPAGSPSGRSPEGMSRQEKIAEGLRQQKLAQQ